LHVRHDLPRGNSRKKARQPLGVLHLYFGEITIASENPTIQAKALAAHSEALNPIKAQRGRWKAIQLENIPQSPGPSRTPAKAIA
jgi:hypothetical protein